jgi:hypothetical protein
MKSNQEKVTKKNYSSPKLVCYGDIRELTLGGSVQKPEIDIRTAQALKTTGPGQGIPPLPLP